MTSSKGISELCFPETFENSSCRFPRGLLRSSSPWGVSEFGPTTRGIISSNGKTYLSWEVLPLSSLFATFVHVLTKLNTFVSPHRNMKTIFTLGFFLSILLYLCTADIYLHYPHGSNNRLNGNGANVRNANRLYDSQVSLNLFIRNIFIRR